MVYGENKIKTKWGNAKIDDGYYRIMSGKASNRGKMLHRLIARDYFGDWIDDPNDYYVIHHIDGNPLNNCVLNLEPMKQKDHAKLHHKDKVVSEETKKKMKNTSRNGGNLRIWSIYMD